MRANGTKFTNRSRSTEKATPEEIARRDPFWNGVVLYREKRWDEAFRGISNARGPKANGRARSNCICAGSSRSPAVATDPTPVEEPLAPL